MWFLLMDVNLYSVIVTLLRDRCYVFACLAALVISYLILNLFTDLEFSLIGNLFSAELSISQCPFFLTMDFPSSSGHWVVEQVFEFYFWCKSTFHAFPCNHTSIKMMISLLLREGFFQVISCTLSMLNFFLILICFLIYQS